MTKKAPAGFLRRLIYIPIIHTEADMGTLGERVKRATLKKWGRLGLSRKMTAKEQVWTEIEKKLAALTLDYGRVRLYQDGLPVCGREREIVAALAQAGSRNHQLLLHLLEQGAALMGTESGELLVQEYELAKQSLTLGTRAQGRGATGQENSWSDSLLRRRDRFIARRINETLKKGETGILFLGMLHSLENLLDRDIEVIYPLTRSHFAPEVKR